MIHLTAIIMTRDEAAHVGRAIASLQGIATEILVVDSGSTDGTQQIAADAGARVIHHDWINYATQFNWALGQLGPDADWVLRLDADEIVTSALADEIAAGLPQDVSGATVSRVMYFQGQPVRHGGVFALPMLRLIRAGHGRCEARWMDEHLVCDGPVIHLQGQIIDDNRKSLDWWTAKHNAYASREAVDLLNLRHGFLPLGTDRPSLRRWVKERIYRHLPGGLRAGAYFLYRYILRGGFRDGRQARAFHVLQGFWYRYLVDAKLAEVERHMASTGAAAPEAIRAVLGIDVARAAP